MSDSATPWTVAHQPPLSWDFPGNNTGVGCHFLLHYIISRFKNLVSGYQWLTHQVSTWSYVGRTCLQNQPHSYKVGSSPFSLWAAYLNS